MIEKIPGNTGAEISSGRLQSRHETGYGAKAEYKVTTVNCGRRSGRIVWGEALIKRAWVVVAVSVAVVFAAQAAPHSFDALIGKVSRMGADAMLPAHLSIVLGLSNDERPTIVKQAVSRGGSAIRTFNVCTGAQDELVILTYNERSHLTKAYLISRQGALRKAVSYRPGDAALIRSLGEAQRDFRAEIGFWADFELRGVSR